MQCSHKNIIKCSKWHSPQKISIKFVNVQTLLGIDAILLTPLTVFNNEVDSLGTRSI